MEKPFPLIQQRDSMQCGVACLTMICTYWGKKYPLEYISELCFATTEGVSLLSIILDEATNALDANNERMIVEHLDEFYKGKTVVIVAHRLSTVKNADQIVVLDKGKVAEIGTHEELTQKHGAYYNLVKNQLELGN